MATPEEQRAYQREWMAKRRRKALALLGGKCVRCGSTEDLEFDHIDPTTKDHRLRGRLRQGFPWSWSWTRILAELDKCQLLCEPCHERKTIPEISKRYCVKGHDTYETGRDSIHRCKACRLEFEYPKRVR